MARSAMVCALALFGASSHSAAGESAAANPIRKVVTMLQNMQKKVTEEGKLEEELFDKYMCYCKNSGGDLSQSIGDAETKIESTSAELKAATENKAQLEADLKEHTSGRDECKDTMAKASALREKEEAAHAKEKSELETNIAAINKAVAALEKGASGAFLQTPSASLVRTYAMEKADIPDESRQELLAFLSGTQSSGYVPQSGEITGILKQLGDEMSKSLSDSNEAEASAIANFEALMAAKKKEVASLQAQIEDKMTRVGNLGVRIAEMGNDVEDTQEALAADQQFKKELESSCDTKEAEWEVVKKTRAEELLALAETIKVLNDDDSLELFKSTLPGASSFLELGSSAAHQRAKALALIRSAVTKGSRASPGLDLIALALDGKATGFEKVLKMIDDMVDNLKKEQAGDDSKKEYCEAQFDESDDKRKVLELSIQDSETAIEEMEGLIATLAKEISELEAGIKALDKSVAEATEQRQAENAEFKSLMASDSTAKEVLAWAKNRLNKFYQPKLYKAPPKRELSEEERITVNMGGTLAPTTLGGIAGTGIGASFVQVRAHKQARKDAPAPPPETFGPYQRKTEQGNGVIAMIDLLVKDLDKEMQEAQVSEKEAQSDYEKMMSDASEKRAADSKSMTEKTSAKASTEEELQAEKEKKTGTGKEHMATMEYISSLHSDCDWLLQYHAARKEARSSEVESLVNAKAVLKGADYTFVQTGGFLARRSA